MEDVGQFLGREEGVDAGVVQPGALAGHTGFDEMRVVLHEPGVMVQPLNAMVARIDAARIAAPQPPGLAGAVRLWLAARLAAR